MKDHIEIIIVEILDLVNQIPLHVLRRYMFDTVGKWSEIGCYDFVAALMRKSLNKSLTNFTTCTGDEHKLFGHRVSLR